MANVEPPFGACESIASIRTAVAIAQAMGNNPIGRQVANLAAGFVKRRGQVPIDVEVAGLRLRCSLWDNYTERKLVFMPWRFDVQERQYMGRVLPADGIFVDVGANVGVYALIAATHMRGSGKVLALEPHPSMFARLLFNIEATRTSYDQWPHVTPLPLGVADIAGKFELHIVPENLGENSIVSAVDHSQEAIEIQCKPLMEILLDQGIDRIDFMKIDIEGAEDVALMPFLRDAPDSLLPDHLLIENSSHRWQSDLTSCIESHAYTPALKTRMNTIYRR